MKLPDLSWGWRGSSVLCPHLGATLAAPGEGEGSQVPHRTAAHRGSLCVSARTVL